MLARMICTEILKMKRSIIPWMMAVWGILPAGIALGTLSENSCVTWNRMGATSLNFMNMSALLLTAVFTGLIFAGEYGTGTISVMFTYPVSRTEFYIAKLITTLLVVSSSYILLFASTFAFGFAGIRSLPSGDFAARFFRFALIAATLNFVLVPATILICNLLKGVAPSVVTGMCYVVVYMSFIDSEKSLFVPGCTPTRIVKDAFVSGHINRADFRIAALVSVIIFCITLLISIIHYSKSDVHK